MVVRMSILSPANVAFVKLYLPSMKNEESSNENQAWQIYQRNKIGIVVRLRNMEDILVHYKQASSVFKPLRTILKKYWPEVFSDQDLWNTLKEQQI